MHGEERIVMNSKNDNSTDRLPYDKPELRIIKLVAEEVLGIGCKLQTGGTAIGFPAACINLNNCSQAGS